MKRFFFPAILWSFASIVLCTAPAFSQSSAEQYKQYEFGPFVTGGASVFMGSVPDGAKTGVTPAFSAGAFGDYMFNHIAGVALALGFESRGMNFVGQAGDPPHENFTLQYFSIRPSVKVGVLLVGVNIGAPVNISTSYTTSQNLTASSAIASKQQNTLVDIRLEGMFALFENKDGKLSFHAEASYPLTDAIGEGGFVVPFQTNTAKIISKSPIPSVQLGLSYLFSPGGFTL